MLLSHSIVVEVEEKQIVNPKLLICSINSRKIRKLKRYQRGTRRGRRRGGKRGQKRREWLTVEGNLVRNLVDPNPQERMDEDASDSTPPFSLP